MKMVHKDVGAVKEVGNAIMRLYPGFMQTELEPLSPSLSFQTVFLQWNCLLGLPLGGEGDKEVDREGKKEGKEGGK